MIKEAEEAGAEARRLDWKRQLKEAKPKDIAALLESEALQTAASRQDRQRTNEA